MAQDTWHIEKTLNVGHILTTLTMAVGALWFISDMQQSISENRQTIAHIQERHKIDMARVDSQREEDIRRVEKRLDKIDSKIDRLLTLYK